MTMYFPSIFCPKWRTGHCTTEFKIAVIVHWLVSKGTVWGHDRCTIVIWAHATLINCLPTLWRFVLVYRDALQGLQIALEALQGYLTGRSPPRRLHQHIAEGLVHHVCGKHRAFRPSCTLSFASCCLQFWRSQRRVCVIMCILAPSSSSSFPSPCRDRVAPGTKICTVN